MASSGTTRVNFHGSHCRSISTRRRISPQKRWGDAPRPARGNRWRHPYPSGVRPRDTVHGATRQARSERGSRRGRCPHEQLQGTDHGCAAARWVARRASVSTVTPRRSRNSACTCGDFRAPCVSHFGARHAPGCITAPGVRRRQSDRDAGVRTAGEIPAAARRTPPPARSAPPDLIGSRCAISRRGRRSGGVCEWTLQSGGAGP